MGPGTFSDPVPKLSHLNPFSGFKQCLVTQPLRFPLGCQIKARVGEGPDDWEIGVVIKHWDECNAYRLRLQGGDEVHAPMDSDNFLMKA